jgi:hypothetical protein
MEEKFICPITQNVCGAPVSVEHPEWKELMRLQRAHQAVPERIEQIAALVRDGREVKDAIKGINESLKPLAAILPALAKYVMFLAYGLVGSVILCLFVVTVALAGSKLRAAFAGATVEVGQVIDTVINESGKP